MPQTATLTDLLVFALTSAIAVAYQKSCSSSSSSPPPVKMKSDSAAVCEKGSESTPLLNSAFVFVKPHANTKHVQELVRTKLLSAGITILSECDITGDEIDSKKLIDQHYYAIASKATILPAKDIPVPEDKFEKEFGEKWSKVLSEGRACNAMEACTKFNCDAQTLNDAWKKAKVTKFGGGFYCGLMSVGDKPPLYVFNAFFMNMRSNFVGKDKSIHCYVVEWPSEKLSWEKFRGELLGPTDPNDAPAGSIRRDILDKYESLGLKSKPNNSDNGVHASASPFEGLAEKINWMGVQIEDDTFGKALLNKGLTKKIIQSWSVDPRIELTDGKGKGSVFDALEDMDVEDCLKKLVALYELNK